ncbi:MAG: hypothetical protein K0B87_02800 [Candidatus Syntrophosphaera sp.]|nr:hypothetical protein [Candidatus Syntrophosphaera sp.]
MKRFAAALLFLLGACLAGAQGFDDLIELDAPALADSAWQDFYNTLAELGRPLKLDSRLYLNQTSRYSLHSAIYSLENESVLVNYKRDWDDGESRMNFRIGLQTGRWEAVLGSFRFRFGRGIVTGNGSRSPSDSLFSLREPLSPETYTPLGAAAKFNHKALRAGLFGSMQKRDARLSGEAIISLPSSRSGILSTTQESVFGATAGLDSRHFQSAALLYWQHYDRPFADEEKRGQIWAASLYSALDLDFTRLDAELAWAEGGPFGLVAWNLRLKGFTQTFSYARNPPAGQFAYALSPALLNRAYGREEYSSDLRLALPLKTTLQLRYSLNSGSGFSGEQLSRLLASLAWRDAGNSVKLSYYNFDREIISLIDSTYVSASPRNHRLLLQARHHFRPRLRQELEFSYSLEDRSDYTNNTYRASLALAYEPGKLRLKAGVLTWQSPRSFLVEDEFSPQYYSICSSEDTALFASASHQFKRWHFSASGRKSLLEARDFRLFLRLGLSIF